MDYKNLTAGNKAPQEINAIIEIPKGEGRVKYEFRLNGQMVIDRLRSADQPPYPAHYCGIPGTLAPDGDPLDAVILGDEPLKTGDVLPVRPIGIFWMTDEKGSDPKLVCVPADSISDDYLHIQTLADLSKEDKERIESFFGEYKKGDLVGKWSSADGWGDVAAAQKVILECIETWNKSQEPKPAKAKRHTPRRGGPR